MSFEPHSIEEVVDIIRSGPPGSLIAVGSRTKPRLGEVEFAKLISAKHLSGITNYQPTEFTFSALAGTPVVEIHNALKQNRQFMPFSPPFIEAGSTIGGAVASGLSGWGSFRNGGMRDFVLGARLVTGDGHLINTGGNVVKNAAGFDIPKLMIGSLGRLCVLCELTFKVFPQPDVASTIAIKCRDHLQALEHISTIANSRWQAEAVDYDANRKTLYARVCGSETVCQTMSNEIVEQLGGDKIIGAEHETFWNGLKEFSWCDDILIKVPSNSKVFVELHEQLDELSQKTK